MKPLQSGCSSGSPPLQRPLNSGRARHAPPLLRGGWEGFGSKRIPGVITTLLLSFCCIAPAQAGTLGRLFFTPEQRAQLDYTYARTASNEGSSSPVLTVNGIVQKQGGARTVWVNGVAQNISGNERSTTAQTVSIPGSPPVKLKVGEKILLDQPVPGAQDTSGN